MLVDITNMVVTTDIKNGVDFINLGREGFMIHPPEKHNNTVGAILCKRINFKNPSVFVFIV
jgi:hypothetical protein